MQRFTLPCGNTTKKQPRFVFKFIIWIFFFSQPKQDYIYINKNKMKCFIFKILFLGILTTLSRNCNLKKKPKKTKKTKLHFLNKQWKSFWGRKIYFFVSVFHVSYYCWVSSLISSSAFKNVTFSDTEKKVAKRPTVSNGNWRKNKNSTRFRQENDVLISFKVEEKGFEKYF